MKVTSQLGTRTYSFVKNKNDNAITCQNMLMSIGDKIK